jgi:uncharacterized membrane protein
MTSAAYLVLKALHVAAVVMFLGNITVGAFWKAHADRGGDPRLIAFTLEGIIRADRWFTMPGVTLLLVAGFGAAGVGRLPIFRTAWIIWSLVLLVISGVAFMARLVPLQRRMRDLAQAAAGGAAPFDRATYARLSRQWAIWGVIATLAPAAALVLMVLKPT